MTVHDEIQELVATIPNIRWIRIITMDGLCYPQYNYNSDSIKHHASVVSGEERFASMGAAGLGISERIGDQLNLGNFQYSIFAGLNATNFIFRIGDGERWIISFAVDGEPAIDRVVAYFKARDYLAHIVPKLESRSA